MEVITFAELETIAKKDHHFALVGDFDSPDGQKTYRGYRVRNLGPDALQSEPYKIVWVDVTHA